MATLQIDRRTMYHAVAETIAVSHFYETMTIKEIKKDLNLLLAPEQVLKALSHARKLKWIKYAAAGVVYLTVRGRAHFPSYDPYPHRTIEERNTDPHGKVEKHKLQGLIKLREQGKEVEPKELANDERARRRIRKYMRRTRSEEDEIPSGQRNKHGRLIE